MATKKGGKIVGGQSNRSTVSKRNCDDPTCPHDIFDTCPKQVADMIVEARRRRTNSLLEEKNEQTNFIDAH